MASLNSVTITTHTLELNDIEALTLKSILLRAEGDIEGFTMPERELANNLLWSREVGIGRIGVE